ncbi:hypothetical protein L9F63_010564, partial [Diploptera punctata]
RMLEELKLWFTRYLRVNTNIHNIKSSLVYLFIYYFLFPLNPIQIFSSQSFINFIIHSFYYN